MLTTVAELNDRPRHKGGRPRIDRPEMVISQPVRLQILRALAVAESLTFTQLLEITRASGGSMSLHARKLESFGFVTIDKRFVHRFPRTEYRLTPEGSRALQAHLERMPPEPLPDPVQNS
jgi:DNA-binding transcriptional ArsR family regulator